MEVSQWIDEAKGNEMLENGTIGCLTVDTLLQCDGGGRGEVEDMLWNVLMSFLIYKSNIRSNKNSKNCVKYNEKKNKKKNQTQKKINLQNN